MRWYLMSGGSDYTFLVCWDAKKTKTPHIREREGNEAKLSKTVQHGACASQRVQMED
jgi:hypothetical protein